MVGRSIFFLVSLRDPDGSDVVWAAVRTSPPARPGSVRADITQPKPAW
ncbi:MAG TPA: hypothetical protein VFT74_16955 [Isosphaeraceae bacterium]|nr:hypothetical protein [Isosphaeraceae bacterium]